MALVMMAMQFMLANRIGNVDRAPLLSCYDIQILIATTMPDRRDPRASHDADRLIERLACHLEMFQSMGLRDSSEDIVLERPIRLRLKADEIRYDPWPVVDSHLRRNHVGTMKNTHRDSVDR